MQNKSFCLAIRSGFCCCLFVSIVIYMDCQGIEEDAVIYSNGDLLKEEAYLDSISAEPVYNLGLKNYTYNECKSRELNLGLDLKGGMNVTLEVSVVDVIKAMSNFNIDTNFNAAINLAIDKQLDSQDDFVALFAESFAEIQPEGKLASIFYTPELKDKIKSTSSNEEVTNIIRLEVEDAIDRSFNILRSRIDRFGVSQPNIQRLEGSGRILVEFT